MTIVAAARAEEREACAKVCDAYANECHDLLRTAEEDEIAGLIAGEGATCFCAAAIRKRDP